MYLEGLLIWIWHFHQYWESHCGGKMVLQPVCLHNVISYNGKIIPLCHLNMKMSSYQYNKDMMVSWPSCLYKGNPIPGKSVFVMFSHHWLRAVHPPWKGLCGDSLVMCLIWLIMTSQCLWTSTRYIPVVQFGQAFHGPPLMKAPWNWNGMVVLRRMSCGLKIAVIGSNLLWTSDKFFF